MIRFLRSNRKSGYHIFYMRIERSPVKILRRAGTEITKTLRRKRPEGKAAQTTNAENSEGSEIDLLVTADRILTTATDRYTINSVNGIILGRLLKERLSRRSSNKNES